MKKASKNQSAPNWMLWGIIVVILVLAGWRYVGGGIVGSQASSENTIFVSVDSSSPMPHLAIGGSTDQLHKVWRMGTGPNVVAALGGATLTIKGTAQSYQAMNRAQLKVTEGGRDRVLASAIPQKVGTQYVLVFNFGTNPVVLPQNGFRLIKLFFDYAIVDGTTVKNDLKYDAVIASAKDLSFVMTAQSNPAVTLGSGVSTPVYSYLFKSIPTFGLANTSPSGSLLAGDLVNVAEFKITADTAGDVGFNDTATGIRVSLESIINDVAGVTTDRIQIVRKATGVVLGQTTINFMSGGDVRSVWVPIKNFPIAAGSTEVVQVRIDTDDFEDTGDSIRAWLDDAQDRNVLWSVEFAGAYGHADILWRGDIYAHTLVKA